MQEIEGRTLTLAEQPETTEVATVAVSVVMPAFNEAQMVGAQIERIREVMDRTNCPYELIVVNDGSTDDTANAVRQHHVAADFSYRRRAS